MTGTGVSRMSRRDPSRSSEGADPSEASPLGLLLATALRALRARRLLSAASLALTVLAVASAVLGPAYQDAASRSFVIAQLASQPLIETGLTFDYHSPPNAVESVDQAVSTALSTTAKLSGPAFAQGHPIVWDPISAPRLPNSSATVSPTLVAAEGACRNVVLQGNCPSQPGQVAVLRSDAEALGLHVGSQIQAYSKRPYVVTALYEPSTAGAQFWFGNGRLQSVPSSGPPKNLPARPAPWITVAATIQDRFDTSWYITVDQRLALPPDLTPRRVEAAGAGPQP